VKKIGFSLIIIILLGLTTSVLAQVGLPNPLNVSNFNTLIVNVGNAIASYAGGLAVIMYIWAGILYLTAGANPANAQKANKAALYATIGLGIALSGAGLVALVNAIITGP
jgi:cytochrome bd-type quinol oxidase subunit 2